MVEDIELKFAINIYRIKLLKLFLFFLVFNIHSPIAIAQNSQNFNFDKEFEKTAPLIVMISAEFGDVPEFGAGIVFGGEKDHILVITVYHILHRGEIQAKNIQVKFRFYPNKYVEASLLKYNKEMDIAVLNIENLPKYGIDFCRFSFDRMGKFDSIKRGDEVFPVGNPNGVSWAMPVEPDKIAQVNNNEIIFQSSFISSGHSGGGLIDGKAKIIGLITVDQPPFGKAIKISSVLEQVKTPG